MRKYSAGFALIESILIFIIVAIIGGTVYFVYKSNKNTSDTLNGIGNNQITVKKSSNQTGQSPAPQATQKYITIKEWGVRMPYDGPIDFTYRISLDNPNVATFSSAQLAASESGCKDFGSGMIMRYAPDDHYLPDGSGPTVKDQAKTDKNFVYADGYYYAFMRDQAACGTSTQARSLQTSTSNTLASLSLKLQAY